MKVNIGEKKNFVFNFVDEITENTVQKFFNDNKIKLECFDPIKKNYVTDRYGNIQTLELFMISDTRGNSLYDLLFIDYIDDLLGIVYVDKRKGSIKMFCKEPDVYKIFNLYFNFLVN